MLSIFVKILSILGILLLCLLGLAVLVLLLVLFFPICYRITGEKNADATTAHIRIRWLFGLLRVCFDYPEPAKALVKFLPFTVFESGKATGENKGKTSDQDKALAKKQAKPKAQAAKMQAEKTQENELPAAGNAETEKKDARAEADNAEPKTWENDSSDAAKNDSMTAETEAAPKEDTADNDPSGAEEKKVFGFFKKFEKIKYTIRSIYDKIRKIWENISYYVELLREEETKRLFDHAVFRLGKILKSIRPRHVRGSFLFGTGSPDTTGYAYGIYGIFSPLLGDELAVTPDFSRAVLEGDLYISGHITVFTILWNGLKVLFDKNMRRFVRKMKAGRKK